jgi:hypothetical protein
MTGAVSGTLAACTPSVLGDPLLDITIDSDTLEPVPTGVRSIMDLWFTGRPARRNQWAGYDRILRHGVRFRLREAMASGYAIRIS